MELIIGRGWRRVEVRYHEEMNDAPELATSRLRRGLFVAGGALCVGLAWLGAVLPGLPTTPWVLLASYCFGRSSPRLQRWLKRSPLFGRLLRDWDEHRGIRRPVKILAVGTIAIVVSLGVLSGRLPDWAQWTVIGLAACGAGVVLFVVPTVPRNGPDQPAAS